MLTRGGSGCLGMSDPDPTEQKQETRDAAGRFRPGVSGNRKGKPRGCGWAPDLRRALRADAAAVMHQLAQRAKEGDLKAAELLLARVLPPLKPGDDSVRLDAPGETLAQQAAAVCRMTAAGKLSPGAAADLLASLASAARIAEVTELEARLQALEAAQAAKGTHP
jgi:hypothetical protein